MRRLLTDSGRVPLQRGELFAGGGIPDLHEAFMGPHGDQVTLETVRVSEHHHADKTTRR